MKGDVDTGYMGGRKRSQKKKKKKLRRSKREGDYMQDSQKRAKHEEDRF